MDFFIAHKKIAAIAAAVIVLLGIGFFYYPHQAKNAPVAPAVTDTPPPPQNITSDEAVALVKSINPDLTDYPSDGLSPKRIEVRPFVDGWNIGFFKEGSGRFGILNARCFQVSNSKRVIEIGEYTAAQNPPSDMDLATCTPKF